MVNCRVVCLFPVLDGLLRRRWDVSALLAEPPAGAPAVCFQPAWLRRSWVNIRAARSLTGPCPHRCEALPRPAPRTRSCRRGLPLAVSPPPFLADFLLRTHAQSHTSQTRAWGWGRPTLWPVEECVGNWRLKDIRNPTTAHSTAGSGNLALTEWLRLSQLSLEQGSCACRSRELSCMREEEPKREMDGAYGAARLWTAGQGLALVTP